MSEDKRIFIYLKIILFPLARVAVFNEDLVNLVEFFCGFVDRERFSHNNQITLP
jgi:hypothetical protein